VASKVRAQAQASIPAYVALPQKLYMTRPAYMGVQHGPFVVGDPSTEGFTPPSLTVTAGLDGERLNDRRTMLAQLDRLRRQSEHAAVHSVEEFQDLAFQLLTSREAAEAFDITRESDALRERYGRHLWGQACLLARRLAQAGTSVISIYIDTPKSGPQFTNWDDHILNAGRPGHFGDYLKLRLPYLDQALAALVDDIFERGLDQNIMVVVMGEFGRTPRLSQNAQGVGRDHWPQAYSALVSGGGLRMGQVVGATNAKGEFPTDRPYSPQDMLATIYRHLGIDCGQVFKDFAGRPVPILNDGKPIPELL
jgi:hypothetical protein